MTSAEFVQLVRTMRKAQKHYRSLHPKTDVEKKLIAMQDALHLEKEVDMAAIDDIHNLVTEFPKA